MTGRGVFGTGADGKPVVVTFAANDAARWLEDFASKVSVVELDARETLDALAKAQSLGVQGARVYDYAHARAAMKSKADVVLTRNTKHFSGLTGPAVVEWPQASAACLAVK